MVISCSWQLCLELWLFTFTPLLGSFSWMTPIMKTWSTEVCWTQKETVSACRWCIASFPPSTTDWEVEVVLVISSQLKPQLQRTFKDSTSEQFTIYHSLWSLLQSCSTLFSVSSLIHLHSSEIKNRRPLKIWKISASSAILRNKSLTEKRKKALSSIRKMTTTFGSTLTSSFI